MNKFFSPKLYVQGLKKIHVLGFIYMALLSLFYWLDPITEHLPIKADHYSWYPSSVIYSPEGAPLLVGLLFIPVLVMSMFSFLRERSGSDYFHSLPMHRACVFNSFCAAVLTWVILAIATAVAVKMQLPDLSEHKVEFEHLPLFLLILFAWVLFVTGVSAVAVSCTGTVLSGAVLTATGIISPIFCYLLFMNLLYYVVPSVGFGKYLASLPDLLNNLSLSDNREGIDEFMFGEGTLLPWFLLVFGLLLWLAACIIYVRRRSETAAHAPSENVTRAVFRMAVSLPFALYAACQVTAFVHNAYGNYVISTSGVYEDVVLPLAICFGVWFVFEFFFKKQLGAAAKSFLQMPILLAVCALFSLSALAVRESIVSFTPDADEVESVSITSNRNLNYIPFYYYDGTMPPTYHEILLKDMTFSDDAAKEIVCKYVKLSADKIRSRNADSIRYSAIVTLHMKDGRTVTRVCPMDIDGTPLVEELMRNSEAVFEVCSLLAPENSVGYASQDFSSYLYSLYYCPYVIDDYNDAELWKQFCEEYATASREDKLDVSFRNDLAATPPLCVTSGTGSQASLSYYYIPACFTATRQMLIDATASTESFLDRRTCTLTALAAVNDGSLEAGDSCVGLLTVTSKGEDIADGDFGINNNETLSADRLRDIAALITADPYTQTLPDADASYIALWLSLDDNFIDLSYDDDCCFGTVIAVTEETALKVAELLCAAEGE